MQQPNVLLIVLDTVRSSDVLDETNRRTTPYLESFANRPDTTHFTEARSPALWTLPSHTSMFTGDVVTQHGVTALGSRFNGTSVFDSLTQRGYRTSLFTENPFLASDVYGLNDAFQHTSPYLNVLFPEALKPQSYAVDGELPYFKYLGDAMKSGTPLRSLANAAYPFSLSTSLGERVTDERNDAYRHADRFLDWAEEERPWAACLNFVDAHAPYRPTTENNLFAPDAFRRNPAYADPSDGATNEELTAAHDLYCGGIRQCDRAVEHIISTLEERGELDETFVVITSDHGEAFGEPVEHDPTRRLVAHRGGLNEEQLRVPLVIKPPTRQTASTTRQTISSLSSPLGFATAVETLFDQRQLEDAFQFDELLISHEYEGSTSEQGSGRFIHALYVEEGGLQKHVQDDEQDAVFNVSQRGSLTQTGEDNRVAKALQSTNRSATNTDNPDIPRERLRDLGYLDDE